MQKFIYACSMIINLSLLAEPVCHKCEVIREYNKEHPGEYEFYEDYLKAQKKEADTTPAKEKPTSATEK